MPVKVLRVRSTFLQLFAGWEDCLILLDDEDRDIEDVADNMVESGQAVRVEPSRKCRRGRQDELAFAH